MYEAAARGKPVLLLKTLLTNRCKNNCNFCAFRVQRKCQRHAWDPERLASIGFKLWKDRRIDGLFLSSGIFKDPDYSVERELDVVRRLRKMGCNAYVHLRLMPGVSRHLIREGIELADRIGINLEAPTGGVFSELCPDKGDYRNDIIKRVEWLYSDLKRLDCKMASYGYARAGLDTQLIVGATTDGDLEYINATNYLYKKLRLRRVYFSGFEPIPDTPLADMGECSKQRVFRLYQVSYLIRDYGFALNDLLELLDDRGFLPSTDPKLAYAESHKELFPINLNEAGIDEMMRVPGIGPITAKRLISAREKLRMDRAANLVGVTSKRVLMKIAPYVMLKDKVGQS